MTATVDITHGASGYKNQGCHCEECRKGHALEVATSRAARRAYVREYGLPDGVEHGASAYTNWGCKCEVCRDGHREAVAQYRIGK